MPRDYRTDTITIEQARRRFNEYYAEKSKTPIGLFRAKLFDMMYQKKPSNLIKCNQTTRICEKGSIKYMLEEGPKTFDVEGVDAFPEGSEFEVELPSGEKRSYKSKGYEKVLGTDDASEPVYGPRLDDGKELYSKHFKAKYKARKGKNLVDIYWDNYKREKAAGVISDKWRRKNKKVRKTDSKTDSKTDGKIEILLQFTIGAGSFFIAEAIESEEIDYDKVYQLVRKNNEILLQSEGQLFHEEHIEYDSQIDFLQKLKILPYRGALEFKKKTPAPKLFKLSLSHDDDQSKNLELVLNITTGKVTSDDLPGKSHTILDFWIQSGEDMEITSVEEITTPDKSMVGGKTPDYYYEYDFNTTHSSSDDDYSVLDSDYE